jgi:transposase
MTNPQSTPEAVVWVAIDIAKDRHEALVEAPGWKTRRKFRVQNTAAEFRAFADFLHSLHRKVCIGFEPTGNYHRALAYFLHSEGFYLQLISSLALVRTRMPCTTPGTRTIPKTRRSFCIC